MITIIQMPIEIETARQFINWVDSFKTDTQELNVCFKRNGNLFAYNFLEFEEHKVHYFISFTTRCGITKVKKFRNMFEFQLTTI